MAKKTTESLTLFSQKKLLGKAHTSNVKLDGNETTAAYIQQSTAQVFGEPIPTNPSQTLNQQQGVGSNPKTVEYVEFDIYPIDGTSYDADSAVGGGAGSDSGESSQSAGPHGYALALKSSYQSDTNNTRGKAGNGIYNNSTALSGTLGGLQIIPSSFSNESDNPYTVTLYKASPLNEANQIGVESNIDWQLDTSNGILFVQDYDTNNIPLFAKGFIYVGDFADQGKFYSGISGSLTQLPDGKSYLTAGSGITITSASNGQITIASSGGGAGGTVAGSDTQIQFNDGGSFGASSAFTFDGSEITLHENSPTINLRRTNNNQNSDIDFKGAGGVVGARLRFSGSTSNDLVFTTFTGTTLKERVRIGSNLNDIAVEVTGTLKSTLGYSGSLTKLTDGTSYILSNGSISVTTQSNGSIVLSAANSVFNEYIGEADGSNTRFTLDHAPTANKNVSVFVNGQLRMPATNITGAPFQDYSVTGSVIFFVTASLPPLGSLLMANYTTNQSIS